MSKTVSALNGAGWDDGIARILEAPLQGMITLRGDLGDKVITQAARDATGQTMPDPGLAHVDGDKGLCWMSPDEVLVLCPYSQVATTLEAMRTSLAGTHSLVVDVSDARAMFLVEGDLCRDVMAKLAPVDLRLSAFRPGMIRRTRMAQVPAAFWMRDETTFCVICFRSHAQYVFDLLKTAAQPGSAVGYF